MKLIIARDRKVGFVTLPLAKYADEKSVNDKGSAFAACKTLWSNKSTNVLPEKKLLTQDFKHVQRLKQSEQH